MPKHRASVLAIRLFGEHSYAHEGALCFACFPYPQCVTDSSSQLISWHLWSALVECTELPNKSHNVYRRQTSNTGQVKEKPELQGGHVFKLCNV